MKFRDFVNVKSDDLESDADYRFAQKQARRKSGQREADEKDRRRGKGKPRAWSEIRNKKYGDV